MTDIVVYTFSNQQVRTLTGPDGEPRFVLADLCKVLNINNSSDVARRLSDSMKGVDQIDTPGGRQKVTVVTEAGMYSVVLRSDKPEAVKFQEWVTGEVLPSIRKTGAYSLQPRLEGPELMAAALIEAQKTLEAAQQRAESAEAQIEADKPHTTLGRSISGGTGTLKVGEVAKLIAQNDPTIPIGQNRLFQWLRDHEWIGKRDHRPTQRVIEQGLMTMRVHPIHLNGGRMLERVTPLLTGAGQEKLISGFLDGTYTLNENHHIEKKDNQS